MRRKITVFNSKLQFQDLICLLIFFFFTSQIHRPLLYCIVVHVTMETNIRKGLAPALWRSSGEGQGSINLRIQNDVSGPLC